MNFKEAFDALCEGKYVTRQAWNNGSYLVLLPGIPSIWIVLTNPNPNVGGWPANIADYKAEDWQMVEGGAKPAPAIVSLEPVPPPAA